MKPWDVSCVPSAPETLSRSHGEQAEHLHGDAGDDRDAKP